MFKCFSLFSIFALSVSAQASNLFISHFLPLTTTDGKYAVASVKMDPASNNGIEWGYFFVKPNHLGQLEIASDLLEEAWAEPEHRGYGVSSVANSIRYVNPGNGDEQTSISNEFVAVQYQSRKWSGVDLLHKDPQGVLKKLTQFNEKIASIEGAISQVFQERLVESVGVDAARLYSEHIYFVGSNLVERDYSNESEKYVDSTSRSFSLDNSALEDGLLVRVAGYSGFYAHEANLDGYGASYDLVYAVKLDPATGSFELVELEKKIYFEKEGH